MAREHKIEIWCDPCLNLDDIHVEGEEMPPVAIGNAKPRVIAMCKEHKVNFFDPFVEALNEMGILLDKLVGGSAPTKVPSQSGGDAALIPCPRCESELRNRSSLASHLREKHDTTVAEAFGDNPIVDTAGNVLPGPRITVAPPEGEQRLECPGDGCDTVYAWPKHTRPKQAMSVHIARVHPEIKDNWWELMKVSQPERKPRKKAAAR